MTGMDADAALRAARRSEWKRRFVWLGIACVVLAVAVLIRLTEGDRPAAAATPQPATAKSEEGGALPRPGRPQHDVMALVNGKDISRRDLVAACVERYGEDVLESLVNKRLITSHCANRGITVTNEEINAEIDRMAKRFQLGREQWLELLEKERGVTPQEYARDIVWPTLALRKLADKDLQVAKEELDRAYEQEYGEMIRARLIVVSDEAKARELQAKLAAKPDDFPRVAIEHSEDVNSASVGGVIQPIRRHVGDKAIEQAAFALQPGQVSAVIAAGQQFVILKCDERVAPRPVPLATVQERLVERIKEDKLREAASGIFAQVQKTATVQNVYNNPELRQSMPGVVATVNGDKITLEELGAECLLRHGEEVLEGEISRMLLEQELQAGKLSVTQADIDAEIAHGAELAGCVDAQGKADVAKWLDTVTAEQDVPQEQYIRDSVWPSAALKKLTAAEVQVTEEDIAKGFEANYGERVRCRAVVLGNMRRAQEVWDKARRNPSAEYFGDLAAEYSVEPTSKALRGEVPPIGKHGGQEQLEKVAFQLQDGQISGIIQMGDKFVILRCEGRTERLDVNLNDPQIREILHRDIREKKLRMAMGRKFEEINERARVDNYLAGTSHAPPKPKAEQPIRADAAVRPTAGATR
ncbi:MAG: peptidylprolyl isomerase [Planctomycetota bacterium]|nr:MAG: peptidylprolyl isomerase [Planctomycetota bacterium]